jgi:hypothetical protein
MDADRELTIVGLRRGLHHDQRQQKQDKSTKMRYPASRLAVMMKKTADEVKVSGMGWGSRHEFRHQHLPNMEGS